MKLICYLTLLSVLLASLCHEKCFADNYKLMIEVKENLKKLAIKDSKTGKIIHVNPWHGNPKSFLFECNNLSDNWLSPEEKSTFRIFRIDNRLVTQWFQLDKNQPLSIADCLNKFEDKTGFKNTRNIYDFVITNFLGNPIFENSKKLREYSESDKFFKNPDLEFWDKESFNVHWDKQSNPINISIVDASALKTIWKAENYSDTSLSYQVISAKLESEFQIGKVYILKAEIHDPKNNDPLIYLVNFEFKPLIFEKPGPLLFITKDSIQIKWKTCEEIKNIFIMEKTNNKKIWESTGYFRNSINCTDLENLKFNFKPVNAYQLVIELKNPIFSPFTNDFKIILSEEEFKHLVGFMKD